jgi:phage tail-like protein
MPMTEQQWTALAHYLREILPRAAPDWTMSNTHDPGVTVLEVLNYALTDLQFRGSPDDRARSLAQMVASQATALEHAYGSVVPRVDPYKNFRFRVKWDGRYVAGVTKLSALKRTTEVVEYRESGESSSRRLAGPTRYDAITLQRGITHDREFETWATSAAGGNARSEVKEVFIELLDEAGSILWSYKVWGCWVSQYQALPALDADATAALIETLRLECEGWQRINTP